MLTLKDKEFILEVYRIKNMSLHAKVNNSNQDNGQTLVEVQPFAGKSSIQTEKQKVIVLEINSKVVQMKNLDKIRQE